MLLLGYISALASSAGDVMQLRRTMRIRNLSGISSVTYFSYLMSWSAWLLYGVRLNDGPLMLSAAMSTGVAAAMAILTARLGALPAVSRMIYATALYAGLALIIWKAPTLGGSLLGGADALFFVPQLKEVLWRTDLSGISPVAVLGELASSVGWVAYTILAGIPAAGVFSAAYPILLGTVAWKLLLFRRSIARTGRT